MSIRAFDSFNITSGNTLAGTTADTGQVWSADLGVPSIGDAISWGGDKVGQKNTGASGVSAFFYLPVPTITSPDYSVRATYLAGTLIGGAHDYIGIMGRVQEVAPSALLDYISLAYTTAGGSNKWRLYVRNDTGGYFNFYDSAPFALTPTQTYILDLTMTGPTLVASVDGVPVISATDNHVNGQGNPGVIAGDCNPAWSATAGGYLEDYTVYDSLQPPTADFGLYFAGSGLPIGQDFSTVVYGAPTPVSIASPVAGYEYAVGPLSPIDLAGFVSGTMGTIKLRRSGVQNTSPVVCRGISVQYRKKAS